ALQSILVPFPLATADHQTTNAHLLSDVGAAVLVPDDEVATESFSTPLLKMVEDADMRFKMHNAAQGLDQGRSTQLLADQVELSAQARSV
ncbi:MAG: UDP-N-acetylglucosamine--N-acetylmuramyl-(pentapeptide) pyrophosphoryl-undecaprenol N-acetylglucosamine transferase, partial [Lancefieldella rimae]|nr:UDP-N-acetylglucosamine--N-acetylmuramyl-(pentapeptide) pyrophosphoryl-undecaprenol N-acetylglucosamine transferase [Lancefieldella rimae]